MEGLLLPKEIVAALTDNMASGVSIVYQDVIHTSSNDSFQLVTESG